MPPFLSSKLKHSIYTTPSAVILFMLCNIPCMDIIMNEDRTSHIRIVYELVYCRVLYLLSVKAYCIWSRPSVGAVTFTL